MNQANNKDKSSTQRQTQPGAIFIPKKSIKEETIMSLRSFKSHHTVTTYPSNNGYVTEQYDGYGRVEKCIYSNTFAKAKAIHFQLMSCL